MVNANIIRNLSIVTVLSCFAATASSATQPPLPVSPLPTFEPVAVEVDISRLPASERAALIPILRAARKMDALYMRQVWPGTQGLIQDRLSAQRATAKAELAGLNIFKGPWGPTGDAFIDGVPAKQPIGDYYPSNSNKTRNRYLAKNSVSSRPYLCSSSYDSNPHCFSRDITARSK